MLLVSVKQIVVYVNTEYRSMFPRANCLVLQGFSLAAGSRLKGRLLWVLSLQLFREIEDGEKGTRLTTAYFYIQAIYSKT